MRVGRLVGDDGDLGRPGQKVYAYLPEELTLGFGNVCVASSDYHLHWLNFLHAEGDCCQGLHPAHAEYLVCPAAGHGVEHRLVDAVRFAVLPFARRGDGDDPFHARHLGHGDRHDRGAEHGVLARRCVGAHRVHRYLLLPQNYAGQGLLLKVDERLFLEPGEVLNLLLGEADVPLELIVDRLLGSLDLLLGYHEGIWIPVVELLRVAPHGGDALLLHCREDLTDRVSYLLGYAFFLRSRLPQVLHHYSFPWTFSSSPVQVSCPLSRSDTQRSDGRAIVS